VEYLVRDDLRSRGYTVIRAYASKGPWDLLAMRPGSKGTEVLMVQVKAGLKPYARPTERAALLLMAGKAGALPVLAGYERGEYAYHLLLDLAERRPLAP